MLLTVLGHLLENWWLLVVGTGLGLAVGSIPGFGATNTYIVLFPFTLAMDPFGAIILLASIMVGTRCGGAYTAITLNVPGTGSDVVDTFDGYPLTQQGRGLYALGVAVGASTLGGLIAAALALGATPIIADFALRFGAPHLSIIIFFAIVLVGQLTSKNSVKGVIAGMFGLMLGVVGVDPMWGIRRADFGTAFLMDGIPFIPALIGVFGISELVLLAQRRTFTKATGLDHFSAKEVLRGAAYPFTQLVVSIRAALIGFGIGALPGAGASVASFIAYQQTVMFAKVKDRFGKGDPRGVIAGESSDNAAGVGALIPLLTLGVPGNASTAIILVVMLAHGITVGPVMFLNNADYAYTLLGSLVAVLPIMLLLGVGFAAIFGKIAKLPPAVLVAILGIAGFVGAYATRGFVFDIGIAVAFGVLGYVMRLTGYSHHALIIGLILAPIFERRFFESLRISFGDPAIFFRGGLALILWAVLLAAVLLPPLVRYARQATWAQRNELAKETSDGEI